MPLPRCPIRNIPHCLLIAALIILGACNKPGSRTATDSSRPDNWQLPAVLSEASGLAVVNTGTLLVHNDEVGIVYRINLESRTVRQQIAIGRPPVRGDFEGIALHDGTLYLSTSDGNLLVLGTDQSDNPGAQWISTGLGEACELEGLHYLEGQLLLPCKEARQKQHRDRLLVFAFNPQSGEATEFISIAREELSSVERLRPTAIEVDETHYYVVTGRQLLLINRTSGQTRTLDLDQRYHRQAEGIALPGDGSLVFVDDISGGRATLTRYTSLEELKKTGTNQQALQSSRD